MQDMAPLQTFICHKRSVLRCTAVVKKFQDKTVDCTQIIHDDSRRPEHVTKIQNEESLYHFFKNEVCYFFIHIPRPALVYFSGSLKKADIHVHPQIGCFPLTLQEESL